MADGRRQFYTGGGSDPTARRSPSQADMGWPDLDWLEETPAPSPRNAAPDSARRPSAPQDVPSRDAWEPEDGGDAWVPDDGYGSYGSYDGRTRQSAPDRQFSSPLDRINQRRQDQPSSPQQPRSPLDRYHQPQQPAQRQQQYTPRQQQPAQRQQQPAQQQYAPRQQQSAPRQQQSAPRQQQSAPRQRPPVQQQRPPQRQQPPAQQQRPPQRQQRQSRAAASPEPWRDKRGRRSVAVEPDDYRSKTSRGAKKGNKLLIALVVVLVIGVVVSAAMLGSFLLNYHRDSAAYNALADEALSGMADPNATPEPNIAADPNAGLPNAPSEAPFAVNWDYLRSVNSDVVGWIYCAGTQINYPVVQTVDNEYYLHRDFTSQQPNTVGTLFVDPNSALGVTYSNYIIYGHNMKDGSMFATIESYWDQNFYNEHPVMYYLTPDQNYRIDLIAGRIVESTLDNYPSYFSDADYGSYLNTITSHSFFGTHASVTTSYQLVTLSTCDYSGGYNDPRFLLQGLLVPIQ